MIWIAIIAAGAALDRISKVLAENADRVYRVHPEFGNEPKVVYLVPRKGAETLCKSIGLS